MSAEWNAAFCNSHVGNRKNKSTRAQEAVGVNSGAQEMQSGPRHNTHTHARATYLINGHQPRRTRTHTQTHAQTHYAKSLNSNTSRQQGTAQGEIVVKPQNMQSSNTHTFTHKHKHKNETKNTSTNTNTGTNPETRTQTHTPHAVHSDKAAVQGPASPKQCNDRQR